MSDGYDINGKDRGKAFDLVNKVMGGEKISDSELQELARAVVEFKQKADRMSEVASYLGVVCVSTAESALAKKSTSAYDRRRQLSICKMVGRSLDAQSLIGGTKVAIDHAKERAFRVFREFNSGKGEGIGSKMVNEKLFVFNPPTMPPEYHSGEKQYMLYLDWLPLEDRDKGYAPDFFIGMWQENKWWILATGYEPSGDSFPVDEPLTVLRPLDFTPLTDDKTLIGWCPLWG